MPVTRSRRTGFRKVGRPVRLGGCCLAVIVAGWCSWATHAAEPTTLPTGATLSPRRVGPFVQRVAEHRALPPGLPPRFVPQRVWIGDEGLVHVGDGQAAFRLADGRFTTAAAMPPPRDGGENLVGVAPEAVVRQVARRRDGTVAAATSAGLFERDADGPWRRLAPVDSTGLVWAASDVRGVAYDSHDRLVVVVPAGIARRGDAGWEFFTGGEGLPVSDFSGAAAAADGTVWFGTGHGLVEWSGDAFRYRQGPRWLPGDVVHDLAVTSAGDVVVATDGGIGWIAARPTTLAAKARHYEAVIEESIARTEHGFVATAALEVPGDAATARRTDDDNDGLWTAMYGAAQCFAYAHDRSADAKRRADRAFRALAFLQDVTQTGTPAPPAGFPARTVLPGDGPDPNVGQQERDRQVRDTDPHWKSLEPRWPKTADGRWWWKADTSSDELDGHYFFLAVYHDHVAATAEEKRAVRVTVARLTDHLVDHGLQLIDHDGRVTRWGEFSPAALNHDRRWVAERGLNSLSMLAYLAIAGHVTGDPRYMATAAALRREHAYDANAVAPKVHLGVGSGNQSDDEMAFMNFYHLVRYESDPGLQQAYLAAFRRSWLLESPERNPFFHFAYASTWQAVAGGRADPSVAGACGGGDWLDDSLESLVLLPFDRCDWRHTNAHRLDVVRLAEAQSIDPGHPDVVPRGCRVDGRVLPVDERSFAHWNTDPWRLDQGGDGRELASGTVFLLPWHMGRYHGFLADD
jgi:hypothetical protein